MGSADPDDQIMLVELENEMALAALASQDDVEIQMTKAETVQYMGKWWTYRDRVSALEKQRNQVYSLILGQCTQLLQDNMKFDPDWLATTTATNPLDLLNLIEKTVLAQTDD